MSGRVRDDTIRSFLTWARNYEEIAWFERVDDVGPRCWRIVLMPGEPIFSHPNPIWPGLAEQDEIVPAEMMLTAREALVFGYGLAVGGMSKDRREWTAEDHEAAGERIRARVEPVWRARAEQSERERQERIKAYKERKARERGERSLDEGSCD